MNPYKHLTVLIPEEAIPDRYLDQEPPSLELVKLVIEFSDLSHFIAYPSPGTAESKIEAQANADLIKELAKKITGHGYKGTFCIELYGFVLTVKIAPDQEYHHYEQITLTWSHVFTKWDMERMELHGWNKKEVATHRRNLDAIAKAIQNKHHDGTGI